MRWSLALVCLAACGTPSLISATSDLDIPATLSFDRTWVGTSSEQRLRILSRSRVGAELSVSTDAPFSVDVAVLSVGGGDNEDLVVRFTPTAAGPASGVLHVGEVDVQLSGDAALPPACPADEPCRLFRFDPATGTCVEQLRADGDACTGDACVENGRCSAGECVGTAASCDDQNACTRDACAPGQGCVHVDTTGDCSGAVDPCLAPACDPVRGCFTAPVADGTPCGAVSCTLANVCMRGSCVALVPPDGFTCAPETPCQPRGVCRAQQCEQATPRVLPPAWTYAPANAYLLFDGVADPQGNFYWVECVEGETMSCGAVSFTGSGLQRFRSGAVTGMNTPRVAQLFDEGRFVFLTANGQVTALSGVDGRVLWSVDVRAALGNPGSSELMTLQLVSDGHGRLWVSATPRPWATPDLEPLISLVQLDASSGAVRAAFVEAAAGLLVADEWGSVYATTATGEVRSWNASAQVRFTAPMPEPWTSVLAASAGTVLTAGNAQLAVPSLAVTPLDANDLRSDAALQLAGGRTVRLRRPFQPFAPPPVMPSFELALYDAAQPAGRTLGGVGGPDGQVTSPYLAGGDTAVVAGRFSNGTWRLTGLTLGGEQRFSCELEQPSWAWESALVAPAGFTGHHFALVQEPICRECLRGLPPQLRVFDVGALGLASSGWVGPRGTAGQAGHPR